MPDKSAAQKLLLKPGHTYRLLNAPENAAVLLGENPAGPPSEIPPGQAVDAVLVFARSRAELETWLPAAKTQVHPGGLLWVLYYKLTSSHKADIHRDTINAYAAELGLEGIFIVSVDEDWSALRLKVKASGTV